MAEKKETLASRFAAAVKESDFSYHELSLVTKIQVPLLYRWANGTVEQPGVKDFTRVCDALGVSSHWVTTGEGNKVGAA